MWFQIVPTRLKGARVWDESLSHVWLSVCEMRNSLNSNSHHEVVLRFVVSRNLLIKPSFATAGRGRSIPNIYSQCWHRTQVCCWKVTRIPNWNILIQYRICFQPKGIVIWHQPKRNALWFSGNPSKWPHILSLFERPKKGSHSHPQLPYIATKNPSQWSHWRCLLAMRAKSTEQSLHEPRKNKTSYFPLHWLVNRDPYIGLFQSLYNWVV